VFIGFFCSSSSPFYASQGQISMMVTPIRYEFIGLVAKTLHRMNKKPVAQFHAKITSLKAPAKLMSR
jgi:hypothetical protein